jgi:hypothetical protein
MLFIGESVPTLIIAIGLEPAARLRVARSAENV